MRKIVIGAFFVVSLASFAVPVVSVAGGIGMVGAVSAVSDVSTVKVVESSERKVPAWVGAVGDGFYVVSAPGKTLEEAKNNCLVELKRQIINSVAQNIKSSSQNTINQSTVDNSIVEYIENFSSSFATRGAEIPFLGGISLSDVDAYYWEKQVQKGDKRTPDVVSYSYSIRYPFSSAKLKGLVLRFREQDQLMEDKLVAAERFSGAFSSVSASGSSSDSSAPVFSTEDIDRTIGELLMVKDYFFDDLRSARTDRQLGSCRAMYRMVKPVLRSVSAGRMEIELLLGDKVISSSQKPTLRSNCATQLSGVMRDGVLVVSYDTMGCVSAEENYVEVIYRFGGNAVKERFYFTL